MNNNAIKLENQLCHRFYTVSNGLTRAYRPLLQKLDLTYPQYIVMMALWESDDVTIAELLKSTHIDGGAMSLMLQKLTDKGYVAVVPSEVDKRVKHVRLTNTGSTMRKQAMEVASAMQCKFDNLSLAQAKQLMELIDVLQSDLV